MPVQTPEQDTGAKKAASNPRHLNRRQRCVTQTSRRSAQRWKNEPLESDGLGEIPEVAVQSPGKPLIWPSLVSNGTADTSKTDSNIGRGLNCADFVSETLESPCENASKTAEVTSIASQEVTTEIKSEIGSNNNLSNFIKPFMSPVSAKVDEWLQGATDTFNEMRVNANGHREAVMLESLCKLKARNYRQAQLDNNHGDSVSSDEYPSQKSSFSTRANGNSTSVETVFTDSESISICSSVKSVNCSVVPVVQNPKSDFGEIPTNEQSSIDSEIFASLELDKGHIPCGTSPEKLPPREHVNLPPPEHYRRNPIMEYYKFRDNRAVSTLTSRDHARNTSSASQLYYNLVSECRDHNPECHDRHPERNDRHPERHDRHPERHDRNPERHDRHPERHDRHPERHDRHPERHDRHPERHDRHPERHDRHPERHDRNPERHDRHPERHDRHPERHDRHPERGATVDVPVVSSGLQARVALSARLEKPTQITSSVIESSNALGNSTTEPTIKVSERSLAKTNVTCPPKETAMRLDRPYRVYLWGGLPLPTVDIVVNKAVMAKSLNRNVLKVLEETGSASLATRLQAYMWPVVSRGQNVIAVGERSSGKTAGYIFPLASLLLDMWPCIQQEASVRIGGVAVIVCKGWRAVQAAGHEMSRQLTPHGIRVVTAWGGMGSNSLTEIQKEVYRGCDVLVSTLPFLMRLAGLRREETAETSVNFDLLSYCFHLVFDDADVLMDARAEDVKVLLREWAVSRAKSATTHFCQQLIVTASSWTKYISDLTEFLFPLMEPTLMISSHLEAAKAVGVRCVVNVTRCSDDSPRLQILGDVTDLLKEGTGEKKIIVFVKNYSEARQLKKLLESCAVFSRVAHGRLLAWQLQEEVKAWRSSNAGKILIISDRVIPLLLQQDIRDAFMIVHTFVPNTKAEFAQRFSFMLDNYSAPFQSSCTSARDPPISYVMLDDSPSRLPPYLLECLQYLDSDIPQDVKRKFDKPEKRDVPLCHYLKAYGSCPSVNLCVWRHEIIEEDLSCKLPDSGIVTVDIVKVLNASRYLVRLNKHKKEADSAFVDLSGNHFTLFMTLQSFCSDESRLKKFDKTARVGDLCLVNYESFWARARILKHSTTKVPLFLIDEGTECTVPISELYDLPPEFSVLPQLVLEVYLCKVRPLDGDIDWTHNANVFVETLFCEAKDDSQLTGTIATSLSHTIWLSPLVEVAKVEGSLIRKESIRSQLIRHEFGDANPEHLELLERQLQVVKARRNCCTKVSWLQHWAPKLNSEE